MRQWLTDAGVTPTRPEYGPRPGSAAAPACYDASAFFYRPQRSIEVNRRSTWPTTGMTRTASRGVTSRRGSAQRPPAWRSAAISPDGPQRGVARARSRRQRSRRRRQHRHSRTGQRRQARLRAAAERHRQDALRHRRQPRAGAHQRHAADERRDLQAELRPGHAQACSTTRMSTPSSSRCRITGTRSRRSGVCRPASTSTSRSRPRTPCGKAARWSKRRRASARSCRSAR